MWEKKGIIFSRQNLPGDFWWSQSHTQIPVADLLDNGRIRIYYSTRDGQGRSRTSYFEVLAEDPSQVEYVHDNFILDLGEIGAFDDCGAMPSDLVTVDGKKYLFYIGWNVRNTVRYHNSIGLAISEDGGKTFEKAFPGPILDRTHLEPHFIVTPRVLFENGQWNMWYCGCTKHHLIDGISEPQYQIKYASSKDGVIWERKNQVAIPYAHPFEANARAAVVHDEEGYKMWFCHRSIKDYRTSRKEGYKIGYAESQDGIAWNRDDTRAGIALSEDGWDSQMIAYPYLLDVGGKRLLFYNGNGFGLDGIGYAVWQND